jgi:hypothetical protein
MNSLSSFVRSSALVLAAALALPSAAQDLQGSTHSDSHSPPDYAGA